MMYGSASENNEKQLTSENKIINQLTGSGGCKQEVVIISRKWLQVEIFYCDNARTCHQMSLIVAVANVRCHKTQSELNLRQISSSDGGHCYRLQHRFHILTHLLTHMLRFVS